MLNTIVIGLLKVLGVVLLAAWALGSIVACVLALFAMASVLDENEGE